MTIPAWLLQNAAIATVAAIALAGIVRVWRVPPRIEHLLWLAIAVKLVLPPVATLTSPVDLSAFPTLTPKTGQEPPAPEAPAPPALDNSPTRIADELPASSLSATAPSRSGLPWRPVLLCIWLTGGVWYLGRSLLRHARWRRSLGERAAPTPLRDLVSRIAREVRVRPPEVHMGGQPVPVVVGTIHPVLIWPATMPGSLTPAQVETVITHELMHLRRGDLWIDFLDLAVRSVWWWYPMAAFVSHRMRDAAERACDAAVVRLLPDHRRDYATALLDVVEAGHTPRTAHALGLHGPGPLKRRLRMIMDRDRRHAGRHLTGWLLGAGMLALVPAWIPMPPHQPEPAVTDARGDIGQPRMSGTMSRGDIAFNDRSLPVPGRSSWFIAFSEGENGSRRLEMVRGRDGALAERYVVNGDVVPFTARDETWLAAVLRESGSHFRRGVRVEQSATSASVPRGPHVHVTTEEGVYALWATASHPLNRDGSLGASVDARHPVVIVYQPRPSDPVEFVKLSGARRAAAYSVNGHEAAFDQAAMTRIDDALRQIARTVYSQ